MTFQQLLHRAFGPRVQVARAPRRGKSRQRSRQRRSLSLPPILETLEDRTLLSGTVGTLDSSLLTAAPASTPIAGSVSTATLSISGNYFAAGQSFTPTPATTASADQVTRIAPTQAWQDSQDGQALLVCAYGDQLRYETNRLQGSMSLFQFQALAPSLQKNQEIIFYCA